MELKNNLLLLSMMKTVVLINLLYLHFAFKLKKDKRLEALIKRQPILHVKTDDIKQLDLNVNMKLKSDLQ